MKIANKLSIGSTVYDLKYSVLKLDDNSISLSVAKEYNGNVIDKSIVKLVPVSFDDLTEFVGTMCSNTVTPTSFKDVIRDMLFERMLVE